MRYSTCIVMFLLMTAGADAQILNRIKNNAKYKAEQKAVQKADKAMDDVMDKKLFEQKDTTPKTKTPSATTPVPGNDMPASSVPSFTVYSKFDFIPGEKVLAMEDFSSDETGDFPARWKTNSSGEIVNVEGHAGKWLKLDMPGVFMPEYITDLPENFTLEFEVMCNPGFRYPSSPLSFAIASLKTPAHYTAYLQGNGGREGLNVWLLPNSVSGTLGRAGYESSVNGEYGQSQTETPQFHAATKNKVKVSVWRQKKRVRVYLNEEKIIDVAQALGTGPYNGLVFGMTTAKTKPDYYLISNIRLAAGAPDTRNKLLTEGRFSTTGILFDVNSDHIKPESYGVLKEIAGILKEDTGIRVNIVGHTDTDGDASFNQKLSEKRSAAVKTVLEKEFGIAGNRIQTSGKGETSPADKGTTAAAKANNRRVEFIKLP